MLWLFQLTLFYPFSCTVQSRISCLHLVDTAKTPTSDLFQYWVVLKIILLLHLDEWIPFHLDLLYFLKVFYRVYWRTSSIVLYLPILLLGFFNIYLVLTLPLKRLILIRFAWNLMEILEICLAVQLTILSFHPWNCISYCLWFTHL